MHVSSSNSAAALLRMASQGMHNGQGDAFQGALNSESNFNNGATTLPSRPTGPNGLPSENQTNQNVPPSSSSSSSNTASSSTTSQASAQSANSSTPFFNNQGNLTTVNNMKDFALLTQRNVLVQQAMQLSQNISNTQAAMLQPNILIQMGILQKLYENIEKLKTGRNATHVVSTPLTPEGADENAKAMQSQLLAAVFIERFMKMVDPQKSLSLSRFFKKGPLGENEHDENTDDELGREYADVDAETDYIKRPRHENPDMVAHYGMLT